MLIAVCALLVLSFVLFQQFQSDSAYEAIAIKVESTDHRH
ncbi:hypothetical protein D082_25000 [Synechocystis sp. PCC 6714]|nr:hypothetical protein D082_25000 [Synechocystis sp. PCC 6714]